MKTSIQKLLAATLCVITLSTSAFASTEETGKMVTVLNEVKNINKIVINGNVEVLLVQAPTESVKVYDSYYSKNALVQQEDGILRLSSFQKETLTVVVYVRNVSSIEANDNSSVKTVGKVNFLHLDVKMKGKATADINANTIELYTTVTENATLKLRGTTDEHYAVLGVQAKLSTDQFNACNSSLKAVNPMVSNIVVKASATLPTDDEELSK